MEDYLRLIFDNWIQLLAILVTFASIILCGSRGIRLKIEKGSYCVLIFIQQ